MAYTNRSFTWDFDSLKRFYEKYVNKDRTSDSTQHHSIGRCHIKPNIQTINGVEKNILTQSMISEDNTIYVIQYDFTLGEDIAVPENCILEFDGGSISAGSGQNMDTITGTNTGINAELIKIFNTDITLSGTWNVSEAYPEWFGAKGDGATDDSIPLQKVIYIAKSIKVDILVTNKYLVTHPIYIEGGSSISTYSGKTAFKIKGSDIDSSYIIKSGTNSGNAISPITIVEDAILICEGTSIEISDLTICSTSFLTDKYNVRTNQYGIYLNNFVYSKIERINIANVNKGIYCHEFVYFDRFISINFDHAEVAFDCHNAHSGQNTTLYFESCHTNGITTVDYYLNAAAELHNCAKDGGAGVFIKTDYWMIGGTPRPSRIVIESCHCESGVSGAGILDINQSVVDIIGGMFECAPNCTMFKVSKDSIVNALGIMIDDRNNGVNMATSILYEENTMSSIYFSNCRINNTLFSTQQYLKSSKLTLFDAGIDNIEIINTQSIFNVTKANNKISIVRNSNNGDTMFIALGKHNCSEYSHLRLICESTKIKGFTHIELITAESVDAEGKPIDGTNSYLFNMGQNPFIARNDETITASKFDLYGNNLPNKEVYVFIRVYSTNTAKETYLDINKIEFD